MNKLQKAKILGEAGQYDSCGPSSCEVKVNQGLGGIYHAKTEREDCKLFKTLMTNSCSFDCNYCANAVGCNKRAVAYKPSELADLFSYLRKKVGVQGLFLSSGITGNPDKITEKMLDAVRIIRKQQGFNGYIHFKVLPGTSYELIKQASELSTRMSINIEAPNKSVLSDFSSCKDYKIDILRRQVWISKFNLRAGQTTQMIINELSTDKDVLRMVDWEYDKLDLKRVYYSAFRPVKGTAWEKRRAEPLSRQNRLYNVDFLMRDYGYKRREFESVMDDGMLPKEDPKLALAKEYFDGPVDVNEASYESLIRVPGIGPKSAKGLVESKEKLTRYEQLRNIGVWINRAKPFINVDGKRQRMLVEF